LDLRVGRILTCKKHESADSLYVETIDAGEKEPRQVVSGLVKFVALEDMMNRLVILVCNMKPAPLRGVVSQAMVLAASNEDHTKVELVDPPSGAKPGDRVFFEGYKDSQPDEQLNPKHKVIETIQPDFKSNDDLVASYKGSLMRTESGLCTVKSIKGGHIK